MKDILFKSKTDMIIEELKKIKKTLDLTKERRPKHAYAKACRRYNVFLIHLNEIPELNEEKRERLKSFIEKQKAEMPQEYIIEEEEKFKRHCQLVQELGTMSAEEKRIDDPDFYRTVFPKTKSQMVLSVVRELELESQSVNESNFMIKSSMSISDIRLSLEYLLENLNNMPDLSTEQIEKLKIRINDSINGIEPFEENEHYRATKESYRKKGRIGKMVNWLKETYSDRDIQPEKHISRYREER